MAYFRCKFNNNDRKYTYFPVLQDENRNIPTDVSEYLINQFVSTDDKFLIYGTYDAYRYYFIRWTTENVYGYVDNDSYNFKFYKVGSAGSRFYNCLVEYDATSHSCIVVISNSTNIIFQDGIVATSSLYDGTKGFMSNVAFLDDENDLLVQCPITYEVDVGGHQIPFARKYVNGVVVDTTTYQTEGWHVLFNGKLKVQSSAGYNRFWADADYIIYDGVVHRPNESNPIVIYGNAETRTTFTFIEI